MKELKPSFETDARLAALVNSIGEVYFVLDRQWRMVMFNDATAAFFGRPRNEIQGRVLWDISPRSDELPFGPLLRQAMDAGVPGRLTSPSRVRPDRIVDFHVAPLGGDGIGVSLIDVTERLQAEQAMRESRGRLDMAVGAHGIGIFDWDLTTGAATWSGEMEDIFGLPRGTFEGHRDHFVRRVVAEDLARLEAKTAVAAAQGDEVVHYEFRIRRDDGAIRWIEGAARFIFGPDGQPVRIVGTNLDITERKMAEQHQRLLINELNHRVKNTLAIVQAIAWQSFRSGGMTAAARDSFEGRLTALAAAHDVLTRQNWQGGSIARIVTEAVTPQNPGGDRFTVRGPPVDLEPKTAVALALAAHELATNAVKYGALATDQGRIEVCWTMDGGRLRLTWRETGGPPVKGPIQRGFGARLLEQGLAEELGGCVRMEFPPEGLICTVDAQLPA
ncbi:MAG TPA: HWE histidine kinase domain-containing protein [Phenylobacterium sp.]|nr:HWE histidine kinase domain-containing protein [Phenylobacterium sp.]